jgi:predicted DCC family thiol-disulfide oxidoreductase YuxK
MTEPTAEPTGGRLVFDGECGFCTRCVGWVRRLDRRGRIDVRPYQAPGAPASVGASTEQCAEAVQWLGPDGVRRSGADAVNAVLSTVTGTPVPSAVYRATSGLQEAAYRWVADHRSWFPGASPHCHEHPRECAPG